MDDRPTTYSTCTGAACGALVMRALTEGGRRIPLDTDPHPAGNVRIRRRDDGTIRAVVLTGAQLPAPDGVLVYRPHHQTCPDAAEFRRRKPTGDLQCRAGDGPMSQWLLDRGRRWHINCEPLTAADAGVVLTPMPTRTPPLKQTGPAPAPETLPGLGGAA